MKKLLKAFTLIELLVVISIITLTSASGIFYFLDFVKKQNINNRLFLITEKLENLDTKIKNYEIFDYETIISNNLTGSLLFINYLNKYDSDVQYINIIDINGNSQIITQNGKNNSTIKIYKKNKLFLSEQINRTTNYSFNINSSSEFKITGTNSGEILNDIEIIYYGENNISPEKNDLLKVIHINDKLNKSGTSINNLLIRNIGGNKTIFGDGIEYNKVFVFFDNNGKEAYIEIKK